jgi:hypothetical protein
MGGPSAVSAKPLARAPSARRSTGLLLLCTIHGGTRILYGADLIRP